MAKTFLVHSASDSRPVLYPLIAQLLKHNSVLVVTASTALERLSDLAFFENNSATIGNLSIMVSYEKESLSNLLKTYEFEIEQFGAIILDNYHTQEIQIDKSIYILGYLDLPQYYEEVLVSLKSKDTNNVYISLGQHDPLMRTRIQEAQAYLEAQAGEGVTPAALKFQRGLSTKIKLTNINAAMHQVKNPTIEQLAQFESTFKIWKFDSALKKVFKELEVK